MKCNALFLFIVNESLKLKRDNYELSTGIGTCSEGCFCNDFQMVQNRTILKTGEPIATIQHFNHQLYQHLFSTHEKIFIQVLTNKYNTT